MECVMWNIWTSSSRCALLGAFLAVEMVDGCIIPDKGIAIVDNCGIEWCTTVTNAFGFNGSNEFPIVEDGEFITACTCFTEAQSSTLETMNEGDLAFDNLANIIRANASQRCIEVAGDLGLSPNLPDNSNNLDCAEAVDAALLLKGGSCALPTPECDDGSGDSATSGAGGSSGSGGGGSSSSSGGETFGDIEDLVECLDNTCFVQQELIDSVLADPEGLLDDNARLRFKKNAGKVVGLKFTGVTPGSIADALLFHSGDIVTAVNGLPLTTGSELLDVATAVFNAEDVLVTVRRGDKVRQQLYVRD